MAAPNTSQNAQISQPWDKDQIESSLAALEIFQEQLDSLRNMLPSIAASLTTQPDEDNAAHDTLRRRRHDPSSSRASTHKHSNSSSNSSSIDRSSSRAKQFRAVQRAAAHAREELAAVNAQLEALEQTGVWGHVGESLRQAGADADLADAALLARVPRYGWSERVGGAR